MTSPYIASEAEKLGIKTEYKREHYFFPREQSVAMKVLEWEREAIQEPWGKVIVEWGGLIICLIYIYYMCWR